MPKKKLTVNHNLSNGESNHLDPPDIHQFNHAQYWGYGLALITYTVAEYAQEWESLKYFSHFASETNKIIFILRSLLFIELVILIGLWFIATINEMDMWSNSKLNWTHWSNSFVSKKNTYAALISLSVMVGLLLAFIDNIFAMSSIFSCYLLFNYWTQSLCLKYFYQALNSTNNNNPIQKRSFEIMRHYWLNLPQQARIVTMMFFSLVSVNFATASTFKSEYKDIFEISAYIILILLILISELVIARWRNKRDKDLEKNLFNENIH